MLPPATNCSTAPLSGCSNLADAGSDNPPLEQATTTHDPVQLAAWTEFHQQAGDLPPEQREVFDLLWYQGLTQEAAAVLLGVSVPTVKRRWAEARLRLGTALRQAEQEA
jgi:DNA-directed RNA polymerase specialized sigma24 family protein